jgi:hypothetical protein
MRVIRGTLSIGLLVGVLGCVVGCRSEGRNTGAAAERIDTVESALDSDPDPQWNAVDDALNAPVWRGNHDEGQLYTPLYRGALPGIEEYVYAPPSGDCRGMKATVRMDWSKKKNFVNVTIKGKNFVSHPTVHRTEGVDYWFNAFHPAPKDFDHGAYRLWIIQGATTNKEKLWYSPPGDYGADCQFGPPCGPLRATQYTSATQPPDAPVELVAPTFGITGTKQFQADATGHFSHSFTNRYDKFTNEGGLFAIDWVTFAPEDLCQAHPGPVFPKSQFRPVASPWIPADQAPSFGAFLAANLAFDLHAEEEADPNVLDGNLPYVYSGISVVGNMPGLRGGVPDGAHAVLTGAITNVQPPIELVPGGNGLGCHPYMNEARPWAGYPGTPINYCLIPPATCSN